MDSADVEEEDLSEAKGEGDRGPAVESERSPEHLGPRTGSAEKSRCTYDEGLSMFGTVGAADSSRTFAWEI